MKPTSSGETAGQKRQRRLPKKKFDDAAAGEGTVAAVNTAPTPSPAAPVHVVNKLSPVKAVAAVPVVSKPVAVNAVARPVASSLFGDDDGDDSPWISEDDGIDYVGIAPIIVKYEDVDHHDNLREIGTAEESPRRTDGHIILTGNRFAGVRNNILDNRRTDSVLLSSPVETTKTDVAVVENDVSDSLPDTPSRSTTVSAPSEVDPHEPSLMSPLPVLADATHDFDSLRASLFSANKTSVSWNNANE